VVTAYVSFLTHLLFLIFKKEADIINNYIYKIFKERKDIRGSILALGLPYLTFALLPRCVVFHSHAELATLAIHNH